MEEAKKPGSKETRLRIDPDRFAAAMDRLAKDEKLQKKLDKEPMEALEDLGIEIDKETREMLKGKTLTEIMGLTEEEEAAMRLTPTVQIEPVSVQPRAIVVQPKSKVISAVGGVTICMPIAPCVRIRSDPMTTTRIRPNMVPNPATAVHTQLRSVLPTESEAKPEKKKQV